MQPPAYGAAYNAQGGGISMQVPMQAPRCLLATKKKRMMRECLNECLFTATTHWISTAEKAVSSHSLTYDHKLSTHTNELDLNTLWI